MSADYDELKRLIKEHKKDGLRFLITHDKSGKVLSHFGAFPDDWSQQQIEDICRLHRKTIDELVAQFSIGFKSGKASLFAAMSGKAESTGIDPEIKELHAGSLYLKPDTNSSGRHEQHHWYDNGRKAIREMLPGYKAARRWIMQHIDALLAHGWTRRELFEARRGRPALGWGLAWATSRHWANKRLTASLDAKGGIVFDLGTGSTPMVAYPRASVPTRPVAQ